jgi:hypothetical protein
MLTEIDSILFPDDCEVVEMPLHNQWVYLIQKNGNSSLRFQQAKDNLAVFTNDEIRALDYVDVYIRNPRARYVSGVNTYLQHLQRDYPELDFSTAFWFAKQYKFLNTHYLPQFHWLANLARYLRSDAKIRIRNFKDFGAVTDFKSRAEVTPPSQDFVTMLLRENHGIELWLYLDQILLELAGQEFTWTELIEYYQRNYKNTIEHVLPKT